jgi:hypothetical protein
MIFSVSGFMVLSIFGCQIDIRFRAGGGIDFAGPDCCGLYQRVCIGALGCKGLGKGCDSALTVRRAAQPSPQRARPPFSRSIFRSRFRGDGCRSSPSLGSHFWGPIADQQVSNRPSVSPTPRRRFQPGLMVPKDLCRCLQVATGAQERHLPGQIGG